MAQVAGSGTAAVLCDIDLSSHLITHTKLSIYCLQYFNCPSNAAGVVGLISQA